MTVLGIIWFILIFVLIAGYFVLDGFDLGAGVLSPFVAKTDEEKALLRRSVGPVWDGNEVWLLTAGGALFAAFAPAYATTFSGFYLAIILVLMGLIVRAISLEYSASETKPGWKKAWNALFFAIGNVYAGIPMNANGDYVGIPLLGLVTPFTLLCGLLGLSMFILQGASWLALKAPEGSAMAVRARMARRTFAILAIVFFALVTVYALVIIKPEMVGGLSILRIAFAVLFVAMLAATFMKATDEKASLVVFLASSVACFALVALLGASLFPNLVVAGAGDPFNLFATAASGANITIETAASEDLTLAWMLGITCVGLPFVLLYHFLVYRTFAGKLTKEDASEY